MLKYSERSRFKLKIINLTEDNGIYTSNVYMILGSHNALSDVNTLVDVGRDPNIIKKINSMSTGVGKRKIDQVILTHNHYDHAGLLPLIKEIYNPKVLAFSLSLKGIDACLKNGEILKMGDELFEVIHTPGHSHDSISLYNNHEGVLFVGDTPVIINSINDTFDEDFLNVLIQLSRKNINSIYFGHQDPIKTNAKKLIYNSLELLKKNISVKSIY